MRPWLWCVAGMMACAPASDDDVLEDTDDTDVDKPVVFERFAPGDAVPDARNDRLCPDAADPDAAADPVHIDCDIEGANFADPNAVPDGPLQVVVWNVERGFQLEQQIAAFASGDVPMPDILLVSELDRGCQRTQYRNVSRDLAEALSLNYLFAVEFVELGRYDTEGETCEHGNALFSRFPLGNVGQMLHEDQSNWYLPPEERPGDEPRLGGRVAVLADTLVGDQLVRLASLHFESRPIPIEIQQGQGEELAAWADASPVPVLVGGDTNAAGYTGDVYAGNPPDQVGDGVVRPFLDAGLVDAHDALPAGERATRGGLIIDLMLGRDLTFTEAGVCDPEVCGDLSDHQAIWAKMALLPN